MKKPTVRGLISATVAAGAGIAAGILAAPVGTAAVSSVGDTTGTPPTITTHQPAFRVGAQLQTWPFTGNGQYTDVPLRVTWSATDRSGAGICEYDIQGTHSNYGSGFPLDPLASELETGVYDGSISDYDGSFGSGGGWPDGFVVGATDCSYNSTSIVAMLGGPRVFQETGKAADGSTMALTYSGTWTAGFCDCASGGQQRATRQAGAAVSFTRNYAAGDHVALVMAKGPARGKAGVFLDGSLVNTVNTYAAGTNTNRIVVFDRAMTPGSHTIRLVNKATAGHPRIDLDAVLVS